MGLRRGRRFDLAVRALMHTFRSMASRGRPRGCRGDDDDERSVRCDNRRTPPLLFVGLYVIERERLEGSARQSKRGGFGARAIGVPLVNLHSLDHPERGCTVAAGAVQERGIVLAIGDRLQEVVYHGGIGRRGVEREVHEIDSGRFRRRGFGVDVSPRLARLPQVDDRGVPHLLQPGDRRRRRGARACNRRFDAGEVGHASHGLLCHALRL